MHLKWINIFISSQILEHQGAKLLFGQFMYDNERNCLNINITTLFNCSKYFYNSFDCQLKRLKLLGQMNLPKDDIDWQNYLDKLNLNFDDVQICFQIDNLPKYSEDNFQSMQLLYVWHKGEIFPDKNKISIIFYDPSRLMKCQSFNFNLQGNR